MDLFGFTISQAVLASLIAAAVATLGLLTVIVRDHWARRNRIYFTAFAAGILVTTALTLFPEALEATANAPIFALAGYLSLYAINVMFKRQAGAIVAPMVAIGLHSFVDGFEYGILFDHDAFVGWIASIGLIAHEFAEGVILYSVLRLAKIGRSWSFFGAFVGAALTTPLGAVASELILPSMDAESVGMLLAAASGALLYLGATHLPTHIHRGRKPLAVIAYIVGVALALALSAFHGEHEHTHHSDQGEHSGAHPNE